jgi:hypothetical protein
MSEEQNSFTIDQFCQRNAMSRSKFFGLKHLGLGPREMDTDGAIRISREAEREWTKMLEERASTPEAEKKMKARRAKLRRAAKLSVQSPRHVSKQGPRGQREAAR